MGLTFRQSSTVRCVGSSQPHLVWVNVTQGQRGAGVHLGSLLPAPALDILHARSPNYKIQGYCSRFARHRSLSCSGSHWARKCLAQQAPIRTSFCWCDTHEIVQHQTLANTHHLPAALSHPRSWGRVGCQVGQTRCPWGAGDLAPSALADRWKWPNNTPFPRHGCVSSPDKEANGGLTSASPVLSRSPICGTVMNKAQEHEP